MKQYLDMIHPKPLTGLVNYLQAMIQGRLWLKIIIAMIAGLLTGVILSPRCARYSFWLFLPPVLLQLCPYL